jgi:hypothetical protein
MDENLREVVIALTEKTEAHEAYWTKEDTCSMDIKIFLILFKGRKAIMVSHDSTEKNYSIVVYASGSRVAYHTTKTESLEDAVLIERLYNLAYAADSNAKDIYNAMLEEMANSPVIGEHPEIEKPVTV